MDAREELLKRFERMIIDHVKDADLNKVSNCLLTVLEDYEITPRCTEIAVLDSTNEELLKMYAASLLVENKSNGTIKAYIHRLRDFESFIGKNYTECQAIDLRRYIAHKMSNGASENYCNSCRTYINAFYAWLARDEYLEKNPMVKVKPIKYNVEKEDPFSDAEISVMRDSITAIRARAIFEFLLSSGARVAEMINIRINDVDFNKNEALIRNGKGGKSRKVYFSNSAKLYMVKYLKERKHESELLFCNDRGGGQMKTGNIRLMLSKLGEKANVQNVHPHRFRHTLASNLARSGMQPQEIQVLLGHSNLNTTMIYVTTGQDSVKSSYDKHIA